MSLTRDIEPSRHLGFGGGACTGRRPDPVPRQLFRDGNAAFWNPDDIDLTRDEADFAALTPDERRLTCLFVANLISLGEPAPQDLQPFVTAMATENRRDDEAYLTQLVFEETQHTQAFRTWFDRVGTGDSLPRFTESGDIRRRIFLEELSWSLYALTDDHSPAAQIRAAVTHNHIAEGCLALTCYTAGARICRSRRIFPGLLRIIEHIAADERRHIAWGTFTCRRHVAADDANWAIVTRRTQELLPLATEVIGEILAPFGLGAPFGSSKQGLMGSALNKASRRLDSVAGARGRRVEEVDHDHAPMHLEHEIATEAAGPRGKDVHQTVVPIRH
ncbi:R2-like ligand-binding oxidase [Amycolatopsis acidiphila]|uniref:R2-like ligand-binding oxidase n=1 Tax=Amycolatopsis acidiphila TaxID=715473 RepID=A0A558AII4_9PSEU|nr:R2-like ligand-binding oxidase [Amycolatopsis acidiphila]TVT24049.1 R2-like ligand-binding oxidase [Amycolatopsis acidiphila]UIJ57807.1 R2-like ligand-binding oxidase [Amycolatopsis acidiphila]GHG87786.1 R2-like ligand binding oxidase [Amycolatopsis acidiphila]